MSAVSRRDLLALGLAAPAGLAFAQGSGPAPPPQDLPGQLLDRAAADERRRKARFARVRDRAGLAALRTELRAAMLDALGGLPAAEGAPPAKVVGRIEGDGYAVEKLVYESLPGYFVPALLYLPSGVKGPAPGVLSPCGHSADGKAAGPYQLLHINLAKRGCVVLTYDPVGQGERSQFWDPARGRSRYNLVCGEHAVLGNPLYLLGQNLARYRVHDGRRGLDYLASRPEVDAARLGCVGNSGGGTLSAYITALDERVAAAVISCYVTALPRRMANRIQADPDADPEQDLFGFVSRGIDHAGLLALCAPRPTLLCTARRDFFPIEGARATFEEARRLYGAAGAADRVARVEEDQKHGLSRPFREAAYAWFDRWLLGREAGPVSEAPATPRTARELAVCPDGQAATSFGSRPLLPLALEATPPRERTRRRPLSELLRSDDDAPAFVLEPVGAGGTTGTLVLCVNGSESPDWRTERATLDALNRAGHGLSVVDPRGVGKLRPALSVAGHEYADPLCGVEENLAYNAFLVGRSLLALRVADVRKAVAQARANSNPNAVRVVLLGRRDAAFVCALAAAVEPAVGGLAVEELPLSLLPFFRHDAPPLPAANVLPALLRDFGDVPEVLAEVAPRPVFASAPRYAPERPLSGVRVALKPVAEAPAPLLDWLRS